MRKTLVVIGLLSLVIQVASAEVVSEDVIVDLEDSTVSAKMQVEDHTGALSYITNYPISDVSVSVDGGDANCEVESRGTIICDEIEPRNFTAVFRFKASNLVQTEGQESIFSYTQPIYRLTDNHSLRVILPSGTGVVRDSESSILPPDGESGSTGRRIFVEWSTDPELGQTLNYQVRYERIESGFGLPQAAAVVLLVLVGVVSSFLAWRVMSREDLEEEMEEFSEDQQLIIDILVSENGSKLQKDLVDETDYSKAKVSEVVSELEERGIVVKKKEGRSNLIEISSSYEF